MKTRPKPCVTPITFMNFLFEEVFEQNIQREITIILIVYAVADNRKIKRDIRQ